MKNLFYYLFLENKSYKKVAGFAFIYIGRQNSTSPFEIKYITKIKRKYKKRNKNY